MLLRLSIPLMILGLSGCVLRATPFGTSSSSSSSSRSQSSEVRSSGRPECHSSQYWDGTQCRHKGKGKGARKHDD